MVLEALSSRTALRPCSAERKAMNFGFAATLLAVLSAPAARDAGYPSTLVTDAK